MRAWARWAVAALLGVAIAVALTLATLKLTDQHVGLAGEPPSAASGLVPTGEDVPARARTITVTTPSPGTVPPADGTVPVPPADDERGDD